MKQTFEKVEKHLYRRQYQTAGGDWSTLYYDIFTDSEKEAADISSWFGTQNSKRRASGAAGAQHPARGF